MLDQHALSFYVMEAKTKDVGKGIARLDPTDMETLGLISGDIIKIVGKGYSAARVLPSYPGERTKLTIQIDGITRANAKVSLGDKVKIAKTRFDPAIQVELQALINSVDLKKVDLSHFPLMLEGLPLVKGDKVRLNLFGTEMHDYIVENITPQTVTIVTRETKFSISKKTGKKTHQGITYEDVGGLKKELKKIREMIEFPIKYPEIFYRLGIEPPKGVLLYGPPGTGKTLIARSVAHETDAFFIHINGPEIMGKYYGESEARLREVFEKAKSNAPSIIFLDEIDAIAPKRDSVQGEVEKRVVAQLLALMDGIQSRGQVVVIGATNIIESIDPALRRPGRFDREITLRIPDAEGRLEILEIHTRGMPLAADVNLPLIARITHGFVGADLEALCREAAMACLREIFPKVDLSAGYLPQDILFSLEVNMEHFQEALKEVEPSTTREVMIEIPDIGWNSIGGLKDVKAQLQEAIELPLKHPALLLEYGIEPYKGILLYGKSGSGKTMLAKAVASKSEANFILVNGPSLLSKWVGETEKGIREIFRKAKQASPCIVFFDEIDALIPRRGLNSDSPYTDRIISQLLVEIDGLVELRGVFLLAATNRLDLLDPAVLRPGRFDLLIEIPLPDEDSRLEILKIYTKGKPLAPHLSFEELVKMTDGLSGAEIKSLCREAVLEVFRETNHQFLIAPTNNLNMIVQQVHFQKAFEKLIRNEV
ncbi:MAG: CDC48 family AAA ATPase [Bacillota bacterium]